MTVFVYTHANYVKEHGCDQELLLISKEEPVCVSMEYIERVKDHWKDKIVGATIPIIYHSSCQEIDMILLAAKVLYERHASRSSTTRTS